MNDTVIELACEIERLIRPAGYHCGITGSRLYGMGKKNDIDIIIYTHNTSVGRRDCDFDQLVQLLKSLITDVRIRSEESYADILRGTYKTIPVDILLLT